jgi:hypothetical protein
MDLVADVDENFNLRNEIHRRNIKTRRSALHHPEQAKDLNLLDGFNKLHHG